uniref:non-specific serine/threonine protein kinase n=1 Tax=Callorhinchus milii TaxID=7868 RepID=A0A4W3IF29_CALMI
IISGLENIGLHITGLENNNQKEVDKFRRLIRTPETIEQLDRNSESRHSKQLNWDTVFRSLQRYIQKETECLQAAKVSLSAATQANRQKKMQEISSLLKYFIRWANKRGPRLKCQDLLKHIMDILQDKFSCAAYGTDYSSILLKDMLSVRKYWCEISQEQWSDLITLYFKMHLKPSGNTNRVLVARIIHTLVRGCCIQSKGLTSKLFEFFSKAMQSARQEQVFAVLEHIMAALNVFLNVCAMNCRIRLCKLGEEIFPTLLYIWTQKRPQDSLKEEIVEFFRLQLHAHHPKGARSQEKGAFAADWPKWQSLLYNLYDTLVSEVNHIGSRGKYSAGSRHVAVKDNLIDLAADICHQLFNQDTRVFVQSVMEIDSTQSASPQGTPSKRRRIELGWEVIRENLQKSQSDFDMIPWLQITTTLIAKYPSGVPSCELVPILTVLHQILSQQRRGERTPYVLWCLSEMATCQQLKSDLRPAQRLDLQKLWAKIWIITLRCISSQQTEIRGFWLLGAILQGGLTVPDKDFWKIFSGSTYLITGVLRYYCDIDVIADEDVCTSALFQKAKVCRCTLYQKDKVCCLRKKSILAEENLTKHDVLLLDAVRFLCCCTAAGQKYVLSFRPGDIQRKLLVLIQEHDLQAPKSLYLHMYLILLQELPSEENLLTIDCVLYRDVCSFYRSDQEVCSAVLTHLLPLLKAQGIDSDEMADVQGKLLKAIGAFCHLSKEGKCNAQVRAALVRCMTALLETDPHSKWTTLLVRNEELSVSEVYSEFLADSHHQVRMLAAMSNSKSNFIIIINNYPVCEKQALFAICQSLKENKLDPKLVKKVLETLSTRLTYRSLENFIVSHLDYLIHEWLKMGYSLPTFPYVLLNCSSLKEFYRSYYKILVPHLTIVGNLEEVKSIGVQIKREWKEMLADCLPKIMVNILPCFAYQGRDGSGNDTYTAQQRENASKVFDMLNDDHCLGKQNIDQLSHNNLPEIVVELLNTLYDSPDQEAAEDAELVRFAGALDPAPNPPYFPSSVILAAFDYISGCHKEKLKSLVAIISKTPDSIQKILLAICRKAVETSSAYEKHRILRMYRLFVNLLLKAIKYGGLGGTWAFVLRDVIYTLIHHINSRPSHMDDVSARSFSLCCDLLNVTCHTAVEHCGDALESHLHVIVATLAPLVQEQAEALELLRYLVITNQDNENLHHAIKRLDPFPDLPEFRELRFTQEKIKYSKGRFTLLKEICHFLSVSSCDSLPLTRLEGLNDLKKQLEQHKQDIKQLLKECQDNPESSILVRLVVNLLQLCKSAINHPAGKDILEAAGSCLGEVGPVDFSTIALQHKKDELHSKAMEVFKENKFQLIFILLNVINNALIDQGIEVRFAAATCAKNILATQSGHQFWDQSKTDPNGPDPMLMYLQPFRTAKKKVPEPPHTLDDSTLWIPQSGCHESWLKTLTCSLLDSGGVISEGLRLIKPMCEVKTDFCQLVLPYLIHDILLHDSHSSWRVLLSKHIQGFFNACCRMGSSSSRSTTPAIVDSGNCSFEKTDSLPHGHLDKISRRTMLAVVDYLRRQKRPQEGQQLNTEWDNNFWLELNYVEVALTAQTCAAHFTALLYAEIYTDKVRSEEEEEFKRTAFKASHRITFDEASQELTVSSLSSKSKEETGIGLQELLIDVYRSIGEPDSLYGCGGGKMLQPLARIRTYEHEALWDKALVTYDIEMNLPDYTRQAGIIQALQNFGLCHTLTTYLKGLEAENSEWCEELQEIRFQAAWRNMQWDCMFSNRDETTGPGYHESVYHAFQSLKDREFYAFYEGLKFARMKEVEELSKGSLESVYSLYPALCRLQMLGELETIGKILPRPMTVETLNEARRRWQTQQQLLKDSDFTFQEPILALRTVVQEMLIKMEVNASRKELIQEILMEHLLEMAKLARAARNTQLAEKAIFQIKQHNPIGFGISTWQLEEAQVIWAKREQNQSLDILKQMIADSDVPLYVECLRLCGNWLAETCLESPGTIMQKYLEKAVEIALSHSEQHKDAVQSGRMEAFLSLARFSDAQYQSIDNYMKSSEFENKRALLKNTKKEIRLMREHKVQANRYVVKVQREFEIDERAICALQEDRKKFLCKAVENYISCLQSGEEHDMRVFRLCSLWLENSAVPEVNSMMKKGIEKIPSYKFLPLMYQLAARMGTKMPGGDVFHDVLNMLIVKTSLDHPHHTLFIILALSNANKDDILGKPEVPTRSRLGKSLPKDISNLDQERIYAASKIINIVRKSKGKMVKDLERLCDAYITLANMDASKWKQERKGIDIPPSQPITKLKNLDDVVIPTMEIKVDPSGKYENLVTVKSFKSQFRLAGGMNLPKIIDCVGSDGRERRQLVKGRDDLRQDAVMQQVFQMCNALLKKNTDTRKRKLTIRTYKVIPLSQRSGFLEWCAGTVPIGEYLVNATEGAHKRYRPNDWSSMECRKRMTDVQKLSFEGKYKAFMSVCKNFRPVFRHFCMEKFLDPAVWFEKRLAYTRSVATSSIVCYIVGLGDRHVQNILIDEESAELVHIDLGVAFEQGKILPTPETVPFRLTRDIVDGMGITGVEGVFRRCCEKTMEVMRNSQEALLTIVEVLLYDPLFDWTMNPLKALNLQQRPEEDADIHSTLHTTIDVQSINKVAERVLLRLQEKLKGVEERAVLSVGGQVNLLIQQARDPKNLSRLFPGWQPWV